MIRPEELRVAAIFADLEDAELEWVASIAGEVELGPGQALASEGDPAEAMFLILSGELQFRQERVADSRIFVSGAGELTGLLPFSRMTHYPGTVRAMTASRVAVFDRARFPELLGRFPVVEQRLVAVLADRVREATRAEQQREKLMALGKLSAGLAHEMNNPAAALRRGAAHLRDRLRAVPALTVNLAGCNLNPAEFATLAALHERKTRPRERPRADPLATSEREEEIGAWLEERGVADAWVLAETFVASDVSVDDLETLSAALPEKAIPDAVAWLGSGLAADGLLRELEDASRRISELVASVKSYSHVGEPSSRAEIDVHEGLESTLVMLGHKVRDRNVRIERELDPALPRLWANPGELNQVWTNLVDNALDAASSRVWLRTWHTDAEVVVEVHDDGPGIPPELQSRIWEPFFTTKDVNEGTGLGLDIARRIVVRQHGGDIHLVTRPGDTCFQVRLPIRPPPEPEPSAAALAAEADEAAPLAGAPAGSSTTEER
ncbi:MAG TPA: ATP-binding protein [Longimicrobium sp.]|nr:ATP-binding protein [Longimicrobium sp.]